MDKLSVFFTALISAYLLAPVFIKLSVMLDVMDYPGGHSIHAKPTPLLGGVVLYTAFLCGLAVYGEFPGPMIAILSGSTIILLVGLFEDIVGLSPLVRLLAQVGASFLVINYGLRITFLPATWWGNIGEIILTILWLVGLTNALNFMDGLDGLASGLALVGSCFFLAASLLTGQSYLMLVNLALVGASLGFLRHNFNPAKIFLGDAGATFLGFTLASIALLGEWAQDNVIALAVPVLILGVPIFDITFITVMRIKDKKIKNPYEWIEYAAHDHFHHRLLALGLSQRKAVLFIYALACALGLGALVLWRAQALDGLLLLAQAVIIFATIAVLMVIGKHRLQK